ncbi:uncharacterized protein [Anabrus simplex]|uniref:uncharacterized protein isoform X2 n=1 Tax=Anabrus simplex TaxID=316456 RepID=UPI0035A38170
MGLKMPCCFVPGCRSGYRDCKEARRYFKPPKDKELFMKWKKAIQRKDRELTEKSSICHIHFSEDVIVKTDKFIIENKEIELPRINWHLKPNSVPNIFPHLPKRSSASLKQINSRKRKTLHMILSETSSADNTRGPNGTSRMVERVTVTCEPPDYSQESLRVGQESKDEEALPQVCIKEEVVVKEEVQDPLEYLEQFSEEQASWSENNLSSREDLMEGDSRAVCEAIPQVWVKEEIEVKEEVQDPLDYVEETSEDQRSCS